LTPRIDDLDDLNDLKKGRKPASVRLDQLLVQRGLFASREAARRAVMAGTVEVEGRRVDKPGTAVREESRLEVVGQREPFVSRAGRKLAAALDHFEVDFPDIDPAGRVCLDVGASTGGFTDCLLQRGAARVYALDVGYGQLDLRLRNDPRVVVLDRINARNLPAGALPETCGLITVDVSFISLLKVVPALLPHLAPGGLLLPMIKPQFEAGRGAVGKGGILRDEALRRRVIEECAAGLAALGLEPLGLFDSPVAGTGGNREAFSLFRRRET
jgi:23S rRNA (cytidine1920-2'-O)/16S rRNA (cytidine1409-2'-O)-methyltransferase